MADNRHTRAKKNIAVSLGSQIITLICGLIVPGAMIRAFGSEAYGATASITQFLAYITLLEGGIGGVARAAFYKPLARGDMETVSAIMKEIRRFFRVVAYLFGGYVLVLACCFHRISDITCMDWVSTFVLVLVISISTFGQYFIGISNAVFLQAAQRTYVTNLVNIAATVFNAAAVMGLIWAGCDLILVKLVSSCIFFMRPVALWWYVRKKYSIRTDVRKPEKTYLTQKWSGLGQHIAFFLHSNTDVVVLTCLADLQTVAVYSVYNMVISHIQSLAVSFTSGMEAVFGDMLAKDERENLHRTFGVYEGIISVAAGVLFSVTAVLIVPFVKLYTEGVQDAEYYAPVFALLLILAAVCYCLRLPYHAMVIAAGNFKETSAAAYGEAVLNVGLSVLLVAEYGLVGVAAATVLATCFRFGYYVIYLSRRIMKRKITLFLKRMTVNALAFAASCGLGWAAASLLNISNYLMWAVGGAIATVIAAAVTVGVNVLFFPKDFREILKKLLKKVR